MSPLEPPTTTLDSPVPQFTFMLLPYLMVTHEKLVLLSLSGKVTSCRFGRPLPCPLKVWPLRTNHRASAIIWQLAASRRVYCTRSAQERRGSIQISVERGVDKMTQDSSSLTCWTRHGIGQGQSKSIISFPGAHSGFSSIGQTGSEDVASMKKFAVVFARALSAAGAGRQSYAWREV